LEILLKHGGAVVRCIVARTRQNGVLVIVQGKWVHATFELTVVTNPVFIDICRTIPVANANGVKLISIAIAVAFWDVSAPAFVYSAKSVADAASIDFSDTVIDIVACSVTIGISCTVSSADSEGIILATVTVAIP